jgi:glycosyltransferase involved in cell wall biosynthesis
VPHRPTDDASSPDHCGPVASVVTVDARRRRPRPDSSPTDQSSGDRLRVLSIFEGFFAGGARVVHSTLVKELHTAGGQTHSILSIFREMRRESLLQPMITDSRYLDLREAGVPIVSLGRTANHPGHTELGTFSDREIEFAARQAARVDVVLALKEQPLGLINQYGFPLTPVVVCLHRSDPERQGQALIELRTAVDAGRVAAVVCCADSTKAAYAEAGLPASLLTVIPNGVDLSRFRPAPSRLRRKYRQMLGVPTDAATIVFAARFDGMKNVPLFLAAAREFLTRQSNHHVIMAGAGMSRANPNLLTLVERAFGEHPKSLRRLNLLGVRDDMEAIYAAADVVALTSSSGEAAPLCLIEGMMCGAIPVATDVGDCSSIVDGHGIITEANPAAVTAAWDEALARRAEWTPALERSRLRFSHTRMAAAYATVLTNAAGPRTTANGFAATADHTGETSGGRSSLPA